MARRKSGQPVNGWLVIDKPLGLTSTQVVGKVRRLYDAQKVGDGCYGKSITDPCLGWEKTEKLIYELAELW